MFNMASHITVIHANKSAAKYTSAKQECYMNHSHVPCNKEIKLMQTKAAKQTKASPGYLEMLTCSLPLLDIIHARSATGTAKVRSRVTLGGTQTPKSRGKTRVKRNY